MERKKDFSEWKDRIQKKKKGKRKEKMEEIQVRFIDYCPLYTKSQEKTKASKDNVDPKIHCLKVTLSCLKLPG